MTAHAGGWWQEVTTDPVGNGYWKDQSDNSGYDSPHGGFVATSNLCKTCHAVHEGSLNSWRLLKSGNTTETRTSGEASEPPNGPLGMGNARSTECMYCHDATSGASIKKPYVLGATGGVVIRGEHTLGATRIPDSDVNLGSGGWGNLYNRDPGGQGGVLQCYQCHSVHGAETVGKPSVSQGKTYESSDTIENWNNKILRLDPAGDGSILGKGSQGMTDADWEAELSNGTSGAMAVRTGFCSDCHNWNPNWVRDTTDDTDPAGGDRPNRRSHPQGRATDSVLEVYGEASVPVAAHPLERQGCRGCHYASLLSDMPGQRTRFPHQTESWKLLYDEATAPDSAADMAGNPMRIIPNQDRICLACHRIGQEPMGGYAVQEQEACFECHASKFAAPNVKAEFLKPSHMPVVETETSGRHDMDGETSADFGVGNRHVECVDCHNVQQIFPWEDTPLTGIWGIGVSNDDTNAAPQYTPKDQVATQYELCFKCHSSWTTQPGPYSVDGQSFGGYYKDNSSASLPQGDRALEFNTRNTAFHPVEGVGRNQSPALNQQLSSAGLSTAATIDCEDCHNSDKTGDEPTERGKATNSSFRPRGPHGSPYAPILRANYVTQVDPLPTSWDPNNFGECGLCHDLTLLTGDPNNSEPFATNFSQSVAPNEHWVHLKDLTGRGHTGNAICRRCHYNIHSNQRAVNTTYRVWFPGAGSWTETDTPIDGLKTHLINFAPVVTTPIVGLSKPRWSINLDGVAHDGINPRQRRCELWCHLGTGDDQKMERSYLPPSSLDETIGALRY